MLIETSRCNLIKACKYVDGSDTLSSILEGYPRRSARFIRLLCLIVAPSWLLMDSSSMQRSRPNLVTSRFAVCMYNTPHVVMSSRT